MRRFASYLLVLFATACLAVRAQAPSAWDASAGQFLHLVGVSAAPALALGTGAGSGSTLAGSVSGSDLAGTLSVTTDGSPAASNATLATLTFAFPYDQAPSCVMLVPANANAAALSGATACFATADENAITVKAGSSALTTDTTYKFYYFVAE